MIPSRSESAAEKKIVFVYPWRSGESSCAHGNARDRFCKRNLSQDKCPAVRRSSRNPVQFPRENRASPLAEASRVRCFSRSVLGALFWSASSMLIIKPWSVRHCGRWTPALDLARCEGNCQSTTDRATYDLFMKVPLVAMERKSLLDSIHRAPQKSALLNTKSIHCPFRDI